MIVCLLIHCTFSTPNFFGIFSKKIPSIKINESKCYSDQTFSSRIFSNSVVCIIRCRFISLKSQSKGGAIAIFLKNMFGIMNFIDQCSFISCKANNGGAIYFNIEKNFTTEIQNSIFMQNSASSSSGGSIYVTSNLKCNFQIKNCSFDKNTAPFIYQT